MKPTIAKTVTVFIPAYNEEKNLAAAVASGLWAVTEAGVKDYELLILNACSQDRTGAVADQLAAANPKIRVIHRTAWHGLGANYMEGVRQARMQYFALFPGDNENSSESFAETLRLIGTADLIIPYTANQEVRSLARRTISKAFILLMNTLFGLRLRYYNGNAVYRREMLLALTIISEDFAYNAEILVKALKLGYSAHEIGIMIKPITNKSAIFQFRNIVGVISTVARLFYDVRIKNRNRYRRALHGKRA